MADKERIDRIVQYHAREAEYEYHRRVGDDLVYDAITWGNIEPFLPQQGRILDAGGGSGFLSIKMAETTKCKVVVLDITRQLLSTARRRIIGTMLAEQIEVLQADIRSVPHPDNSFDFTLCEADPICICGDHEKAISELARVLRKNGYLVAGVDSTLYRVFRALSEGKSLDYVLSFLQTGISLAEEGAPFDAKSFTPMELILLLQKHGLETVKIVGKPIGFGPDMLDSFVAILPVKKRKRTFLDASQRKKLAKILHQIYAEPYIAGMGSHLQVVAVKK